MRVVRYTDAGRHGLGIETDDGVLPVEATCLTEIVDDVVIASSGGRTLHPDRILAPIDRPGKILGSGVNFRGHLEENPKGVLPTVPEFFSKLPSSVIGPGDPIVIPHPDRKVDYEVELAIVIGSTTRNVTREQALEYVFGYTIVHDVSARDLQFQPNGVTLGKGLDSFCPIGPAVVTVDELGDASGLELATYLNGERVQAGNTSAWLFGVATIVEYLSSMVTLEPGDIVTTGTPAGVGCFRSPELYLQPGDEVTVEVEGIGRLTNPVVAGWDT